MSKPIAVVGAGLVGRGWAIVFARGGHWVRLSDVNEERLERRLRSVIEKNLADLAAHGLVANPDEIRAQIIGTTDLPDALQEVTWVQECVFEKVEVKREIFQSIDEKAPANATLGSSTSTFPGSVFTSDLPGRHRCLVAHPINPPYLVPLVEIVPTPWTSPEIPEAARAFMVSLQQVPIVLRREVPGFIVNRLQVALLSEAFRLVEDNVIGAVDLDRAIANRALDCGGHSWVRSKPLT